MTTPHGLTVREADPADGAGWDALVRRFPNRRVTHLSAWLRSLESAGHGTPLYLVFEKDGESVGCLPGLLARMGPFTMFGSPRAGWQTVSLGPAFDASRVTTGEIMAAALPHLERGHKVAHVELMHTGLDAEAMRAAGFRGQSVFTYRTALFPGDADRTLRQFKDSARRNINRARRLGIEVGFVTDEQPFVDEHYEELREVYTRNGATMPFSRERLLATFRNLSRSGNLLAVQATLPGGGRTIATGMFFVEGSELSLWMWAHRQHYRWYRPTELMTWTVIERALALGCTTLDFMGAGEFKTRLGAEPDETKVRWLRSRPAWLLAARDTVGSAFYVQQALRGRIRRGADDLKRRVARWRLGPRAAACVMGDADLVRTLALAGIPTTLIAPPEQAARYSRATRAVLPWTDPVQAPEKLAAELVAYGQAQAEPPVLFYQDDAGLLFVSRYRDRLATAFRFVIPDAALVELLVDKGRFQKRAQQLKLPVPPALVVEPVRAAPPPTADLTFPVIVKPLKKSGRFGALAGGSKAMRVESADALGALWPELAALGLPLLIQSLIPGPETAIESYHVYVDERGATAAEFTGRKIRTWPLEYGDSCALTISDAPDVAAKGREVIKKLKLRGLAKADFKRAPDGTLYLLEVNARCTLWLHLAAAAGLNIPALIYGDLHGLPRPTVQPARVGATWCKPWTDHRAARACGIPLVKWLAWALRADALSAFAWDDPMPLVGAGLSRLVPRRFAVKGPGRNTGLMTSSVAKT